MEIRIATMQELENWWDKEIKENAGDNSLVVWKNNFIEENINGKRKTFFAFDSGKYVGQGTLLFESKDKVMTGDGKAEIIKLEIEEEYRGKGVATEIYKALKFYAKSVGIKTLTIGVEPSEIRNMQIYFHWGFTNLLQCITENYPPKNDGDEGEIVTVLCYSQNI